MNNHAWNAAPAAAGFNTRARQTYSRKPGGPGCVSKWDLSLVPVQNISLLDSLFFLNFPFMGIQTLKKNYTEMYKTAVIKLINSNNKEHNCTKISQ